MNNLTMCMGSTRLLGLHKCVSCVTVEIYRCVSDQGIE
jgi:hypothetical protein